MDKLFLVILNNTLVAGWMILAVIVFRFICKKAPKWVNCLLWGLVGIRLAFPFSIESIFSLIPSAKPIPSDIEYAAIPQIDAGIKSVNTVINPVLANSFAASETASVNPMQVVIIFLSYAWIIGVAGLVAYAFVSFILLKRRVKQAEPLDQGIFQCKSIESPFILGVIKPRIYVPDDLDDEAYACVMEHERMHIKRGDHVWKPLGFLILSVYWFNPLCWLAYILLCRDIEFACDEKVTKDKDKAWKAKYCQVLLDCSSQRRMISACPVAFGEVSVKDRVKSVIRYKKPAFWMIIASIIIVVIVVVCFMTNPKNDNPMEGNDSENNIVEAGEYTPKDTLNVEELASGEEEPENYTISKSNNDKKEQMEQHLAIDARDVFEGFDEIQSADAYVEYHENNGQYSIKLLLESDTDISDQQYTKYFDYLNRTYAQVELIMNGKLVANPADENLDVKYVEKNGHYVVDGDMVLVHKLVLIGQASTAEYPVQYIVLTNDPDITWEQVDRSYNSNSPADWLPGAIIIGMKILQH